MADTKCKQSNVQINENNREQKTETYEETQEKIPETTQVGNTGWHHGGKQNKLTKT